MARTLVVGVAVRVGVAVAMLVVVRAPGEGER